MEVVLTLEKKSKISLKQWVTTIRRYEYELPRLYEKLEYLKVRSIGYSSPSFEPKFGGKGYSNNYSIDYWLERMEACEAQIKKREQEISRFNEFTSKLDEVSKEIFLSYYYYIFGMKKTMNKLNISHHEFYRKLKVILKLYNKCFDEIKRF